MSGPALAQRPTPQSSAAPRRGRVAAEVEQPSRHVHSSVASLQADAGNHAVSRLLGGGAPLGGGLRAEMEAAFGTGFAEVRVYDSPRAHAAAAALHADAFTHGNAVAFGRGRFAPASRAGRRLLAHELAHVVQQRRGGVPPSLRGGTANEAAANRAAGQVAQGQGPVAVEGASAVGVARAESAGSEAGGGDATALMNGFRRWVAEAIVSAAGYAGPGAVLVAKANEGMSDQLFQELWVEGKGKSILMKMAGSAGITMPVEAIAGYNLGVVEGMASPLTDMFGMAVFAENARNMGWSLLQSAYNSGGEIGPEVQALLAAADKLKDESSAALKELANDPDTLNLILSIPGSINELAQQRAYQLGKAGASKVVAGMESPWSEAEEAAESPEFGLSTAFSWMQSKAGALHDWAVSTPWTKIGENVGYAVGFVAIQVILLAMTAGVGELVEGVGAAMGRLGSVLARISPRAGTAATHAGEFVILLGRTIGTVEAAIGALAGKLAAPLEKLLTKILDPLHEFLGALLDLLKKTLGIAERKSLPLPDAERSAQIARRIQGTSPAEFDADDVPTEIFTPQARAQQQKEARVRTASHQGSTDIEDWPEVESPEIEDWPQVVPHHELGRPHEQPAPPGKPQSARAAQAREAGPTLVPGASETLVPPEEPIARGWKVFTPEAEGSPRSPQSWSKRPEADPGDFAAEGTAPTWEPTPGTAAQRETARQEGRLIESPIAGTRQSEIFEPGTLQREYGIEHPPPQQRTPEIAAPELSPEQQAAATARRFPETDPRSLEDIEEMGDWPQVVEPEELGPPGFVKWPEPDPNDVPTEIIEEALEPTETIPPHEMASIIADARTRVDWPEVVEPEELLRPPPAPVVNRRRRRRRSETP